MITWILITHGSVGKILEVKKNSEEITVIMELSHPKTAKKELVGKSPSEGTLRHAIDYDDDIEKHERHAFAKEIADFLTKALSTKRFGTLILVAAPAMLGELRPAVASIGKHVKIHELGKDLLPQRLSDFEMVKKICTALGLPYP